MNEIADVLRRGADVLDRRGWCQDVMYDAENRCCTRGAILIAAKELRAPAGFMGLGGDAEVTLSEHLGGASVTEWNDHPGRTVDEVKAALLAAAERAEAGA